jgi:hypothetical protein
MGTGREQHLVEAPVGGIVSACRAAIGLADWLLAMRRLGLDDGDSAGAVARLLGIAADVVPAVAEAEAAPPVVVPPPLLPTPPPPAPRPPVPPAGTGQPGARWRGGVLQLRSLRLVEEVSGPEGADPVYRFRVRDPVSGQVLLSGPTHYPDAEAARKAMARAIAYGASPHAYERWQTQDGRYRVNLVDEAAETVARRIEYFPSEAAQEAAIAHSLARLRGATPPPVPLFAQPPLAPAAPPVAAPLPPLLDPARSRALLAAMASAPAPSGEIDIERLAAWLAAGRLPRHLPECWQRTLRRGVQVLVDAAPGMQAFEHDARQFVAALRRLLPPQQVQSGHWLGGDELACWMDGARAAAPWQPPPAGGPMLLLTDFSRGGWQPLLRAAAAHGLPLRALVPRPPHYWPAAARRLLHPVHWERSLTVAALRPSALPPVAPVAADARGERVLALAALCSLAVRVDPPLLRRLRLRLPGADAGTEAAVWAGEWIESQGVDGFVFDAAELPRLRGQLVATPGALALAWQETQAAHAGWPASLRLEERLTWLVLAGQPADWDAEWEPVLAAVAAGGDRAKEVARWAVRAVPRLPPAARDADAARAVLLASALRIGGAARTLAGPMPGPAHRWLLAPPAETADWTVEAAGAALLLRPRRPDDPPERVLQLAATRPPLVELAWTEGGTERRRLCPVQAGQPLPLPDDAQDVELRALGGDAWRVLAAEAAPETAEAWRDWQALMVHDGVPFAGAMVLPGCIVTARPTFSMPSLPSRLDELRIAGARLTALSVDVAEDVGSALVLLQLTGSPTRGTAEIADALPAPEGSPVLVASWHEDSGAGFRSHRARAERPGWLRLDDVSMDPPLPGAPLLISSRLAGISLGNEFAADGPTIRRFMSWAVRPPEHYPAVQIVASTARAESLRNQLRPLLATLRLREHRGPSDLPAAAALVDLASQQRDAELGVLLRGWTDPLFGVVSIGPDNPSAPILGGRMLHDVSDPELRSALHDAADGPSRRLRRSPDPARARARLLELDEDALAAGDDAPSLRKAVERLLSRHDRDAARELLDLWVMSQLPDGPWTDRLLLAERGSPLAMAVVPQVLAKLALAKAFYPLPPFRAVPVRTGVASADGLCAQVASQAAEALRADPAKVEEALAEVRTPYFVLLMNPLPPASVLHDAARRLPGARLIGLAQPGTAPPGYEPLGLDLPEGGLRLQMEVVKQLSARIDPRPQDGVTRARRQLKPRKETRP